MTAGVSVTGKGAGSSNFGAGSSVMSATGFAPSGLISKAVNCEPQFGQKPNFSANPSSQVLQYLTTFAIFKASQNSSVS
jgi:hypothetical protein